ncbi:hypothetical protein vseg_018256 [Gypsophila vaccaria]
MGFEDSNISQRSVPLVGFSGETKYSVGKISIPSFAQGVNKQVTYLVIDNLSSFNVILGRSWLHDMRAVPSTYHQCIKFPTPWGVHKIQGDRRAAQECYAAALKPTTKQATA